MKTFHVGQGSRHQLVVDAEDPVEAARQYADKHPGEGDIFVLPVDELPESGGAWTALEIVTRSEL